MSLGKKIRELRIAKGITQSDLGAAGLVTPSMISQIESDKANPSYKLLKLIAEKLETPIEYFLADIQTQLEVKTLHKTGQALLASGNFPKALEALKDVHSRNSPTVDQVEVNLDLGQAYLYLHNYDDAFVHFKHALEAAEQNGKPYAAVHALHYLGLAEKAQNKYHSAVYYWRTAYERFDQLEESEPFIQSQILINLATIHQELSEFKESLKYLEEAYQFLKNGTDIKGIGDIYLGLGISYSNLRDYHRAEEYIHYATAIFESIKNIRLSIDTKKHYAILKAENGDCAEGIRLLEECIQEYNEHNYSIDAAATLGEIAGLHLRERRFEEAKRECKKALSGLTNEHVEKASVLRVLAKTEDALGQLEIAIKHAEKAKGIFKRYGALNEVVETLFMLDELYQKHGDPQKAAECVRYMKQILDEILRGRGIVL